MKKSVPDREPEPSEVSEAFQQPVRPLQPSPGAFEAVRGQARSRRRRRVLWTGLATASCVAACSVAFAVTNQSSGGRSDTVASDSRTVAAEEPAGSPGTAADTPSASGAAQAPDSVAPVAPEKAPARGAAPTCATGNLGITLGRGEGAAGSSYRPLRITNQGAASCTLLGYPGVSFVDADGRQIGAPAERVGAPAAAPVTLKPGGHAEVTLRILNAAVATRSGCRATEAAGIRVYPPGERASAVVHAKGLRGCASDTVETLTVTAFHGS